MILDKKISERFWKRAEATESGCWNWSGHIQKKSGYAQFKINRKYKAAHRIAYLLAFSEIPAGLVIDHLCRNRKCVNPHHLEAVTFAENVLRGVGPTAVNARKTHCAKGHPYSEENTAHRKNKNVPRVRVCRTCERKASLDYKRRKKLGRPL